MVKCFYGNKRSESEVKILSFNMKPKIFIDNIAFSIQQIGGISVVWFEILKRLLKDDRFDVRCMEFSDAKDNYYRKLLDIHDDRLIKEGGRIAFQLKRYINPHLNDNTPFIFHSSYYRTARNRNAVNVTTVHDFVYERSGSKDLPTKVHIWQQKNAVMNSDAIVCISENTKRDLLSFYHNVDESKVHVVYNGVSDDYRIIESNVDNKFPFKRGTYCMYVGGRPAYKNFRLAVDSVAVTAYNFVIVGPKLSQAEEQMLKDKLGERRYVAMSKVPNEDLNILYNGAFCLFYLSSYEGFGIPCIESQKSGCPVIAYNASSIPEVVADKDTLIQNLNVESVIEKIRRLENAELRRETVVRGVEFAKKFSWDNTYNNLATLYLDAIGSCEY